MLKSKVELSELKKAAFEHCMNFALERVSRIKNQIGEIVNALTSETKNSAGDKHETGRAMLQLERENLGVQLAEAERMLEIMGKVNISFISKTIGLGTLVVTSGAIYFIAISTGEFKHETRKMYCISPSTPIGKLLLGKGIGQSFQFSQNTFKILDIA